MHRRIISQILTIGFLFPFILRAQQAGSPNICLNQIGYYNNAPKVAVIKGAFNNDRFYILRTGTADTLYRGRLSARRNSQWSSTETQIADFSAFTLPGNFSLSVPEAGRSFSFTISENIFHSLAAAVVKGFYFQRMSLELDVKYAGIWQRKAGHPDTAVIVHPSAANGAHIAGSKISSPGGWYDAGDYNKYIVNSGITMGTLLSAYEDFPEYFAKLKTNIPESNNGVPDIVDEIVYNLRWMLTMQDQGDGGVYNKCTNAGFDKMVMPEAAILPRYVVQKSTAATLDFAAVTAQATRILKQFPFQFAALSDSCLRAAALAWTWAEANPNIQYNQDSINKQFIPKITTGAYGDKYFKDELTWAANELWATTQQAKYEKAALQTLNDSLTIPSWSNVQLLGYYTLLRSQRKSSHAAIDLATVSKKLILFADTFIKNAGNNAFGTIMGQSQKDFIWGSNSVAANQGILMINAFLLTGDKKYVSYALSNLDYLLGRNATGYCFVTGYGSKSTLHPHHRISIADNIEAPVPGLLVGGPNPGMQDHCHYDFTETETAYSDTDCAYASNEIAINWNAPLVYLVNAIEALQTEVGYSKK